MPGDDGCLTKGCPHPQPRQERDRGVSRFKRLQKSGHETRSEWTAIYDFRYAIYAAAGLSDGFVNRKSFQGTERMRQKLFVVASVQYTNTSTSHRSSRRKEAQTSPAEIMSLLTSAATVLECADMSALWFDATCRVGKSGDISPHSKFNTPTPAPPHPAPTSPHPQTSGQP